MIGRIEHKIYALGRWMLPILLLVVSMPAHSQDKDQKRAAREANRFLQEAEEALENEDLETAEAYYRAAISKDPSNATARYNMGNLYHDLEKPSDWEKRHAEAAERAMDKEMKHKAYHNKGNAHMAQEDYPEAIEAYKNALRADPTDDETRYNLALAKKKWEEEQESGGGQDSEDQEGESPDQDSENQDDQHDQQQDSGEQQQGDQGEPQEGDQQNQDQQQDQGGQSEEGNPQERQDQGEGQDQQDEGPPQPQQPIPGQLSPQQIESLLEAMNNEERKVRDKINAEKIQGVPPRSGKDW